MLYFYERHGERKTCEVRLNPSGPGYELIITENGAEHIERFETIDQLLSREHELRAAWRAMGWKEATP